MSDAAENAADRQDTKDQQARGTPQSSPEVPITPTVPPDPNWYAKIQRAREAREAGIKMRKNRPAAVTAQYSPV